MKRMNNPAKILQEKQDKLDWNNFNFLENLFVFCARQKREAPKESGVHFRITSDSRQDSICILFEIDSRKDPLIKPDTVKRPDYMSLYINPNSCIFTIIEMKGTNKNSLERGIEQILSFRERLQQEICQHFPKNFKDQFKVKFQGILLTPYNVSIPQPKIAKEAKNGFIILPLQYGAKAELYPYVSKENKRTEIYKHQKICESESLLIEKILTTSSLPKRITNDSSSPQCNPNERIGINIDYLLPHENDYITLSSNESQIKINLRGNSDDKEIIKKELESLKLTSKLKVIYS
jgi:hypothetical protein